MTPPTIPSLSALTLQLGALPAQAARSASPKPSGLEIATSGGAFGTSAASGAAAATAAPSVGAAAPVSDAPPPEAPKPERSGLWTELLVGCGTALFTGGTITAGAAILGGGMELEVLGKMGIFTLGLMALVGLVRWADYTGRRQ